MRAEDPDYNVAALVSLNRIYVSIGLLSLQAMPRKADRILVTGQGDHALEQPAGQRGGSRLAVATRVPEGMAARFDGMDGPMASH